MRTKFPLIFLMMLFSCLFAEAQTSSLTARIHYHRDDGAYAGWGLHIWGAEIALPQGVTWNSPFFPTGKDDYGVIWDIPLRGSPSQLSFIIHAGETKNNSKDLVIKIPIHGLEVWVLQGDNTLYTTRPGISAGAEPAKPAETPVKAPSTVVIESAPKTTPTTQPPPQTAPAKKADPQETVKTGVKDTPVTGTNQTPPQVPSSALGQKTDVQLGFPWIAFVLGGICLVLFLAVLFLFIRVQGLKKALIQEKNRTIEESQILVQETEARMIQKSVVDELTSLPNRAGLNQSLPMALNKAKRYQKQLAVIFIDLDHFKPINDTLGHEAGDYVLKTIADRFKECLRSSDLIARLGGDEFVVVIEELLDPKFVAGVAQKLLAAAQKVFVIDGQEIQVSALMGIATYPADGKDPAALLRNADAAMYRAKEKGKNNFQYYSEELNTHSLQRLALESSLRHALERQELVLHYQPIVDTVSGKPVFIEALVRWNHPDMGIVSPGQFIPIAEENGMIVEIGRWVMDTACRQGKKWLSAGYPVQMSVNVSPLQLNDGEILTQMKQIFHNTGFPAQAVTLELTETHLMTHPDEYLIILEQLKEMGVQIALDDFGTGYSSLSFLKRFPIDTLKIHKSFLQGIPQDEENGNLTSAITGLAQKFNLLVVAEGVETEPQRRFLVDQGCHLSQGYLFCRPGDAAQITNYLSQNRK